MIHSQMIGTRQIAFYDWNYHGWEVPATLIAEFIYFCDSMFDTLDLKLIILCGELDLISIFL